MSSHPDYCQRCGQTDTGTYDGYCNACTFRNWQERQERADLPTTGPTKAEMTNNYRV